MNRWIAKCLGRLGLADFLRSALLLAGLGSATWLGAGLGAGPALAQSGRIFPPQAQRAQLQVTQAPDILLNGKPARLAPGARIRAANDLLVLSASLTGQILAVHVLLEPGGLVKEVWILSPEEASRASASP
jgi:hypothetical protein